MEKKERLFTVVLCEAKTLLQSIFSLANQRPTPLGVQRNKNQDTKGYFKRIAIVNHYHFNNQKKLNMSALKTQLILC